MIISRQSTVSFDSCLSGPRSRTHLTKKKKPIITVAKLTLEF